MSKHAVLLALAREMLNVEKAATANSKNRPKAFIIAPFTILVFPRAATAHHTASCREVTSQLTAIRRMMLWWQLSPASPPQTRQQARRCCTKTARDRYLELQAIRLLRALVGTPTPTRLLAVRTGPWLLARSKQQRRPVEPHKRT